MGNTNSKKQIYVVNPSKKKSKLTKTGKDAVGLNLRYPMSLLPKVYICLFVFLLASAIVFRIFKAHIAGIVYDESFTFLHFGKDIYQSPTLDHPNFHVLTAIFNQWAHKLFGSYEHFIRIPSVLFSLMFSVSIGYVILKTIKLKLLQLSLLLFLLFNPFTLNLSFLARGYSIALGSVYVQFAFIIWLIEHKVKSRHQWMIIVIIALTNFLVFGSMPSCVWVLFGTNLVFILLYSKRVLNGQVNYLKAVIINIACIAIGTLTPLFLIYHKNFASILGVRNEFGVKASWARYMSILLKDKIVNPQSNLSNMMHWVLIGVFVFSVFILLYQFTVAIRKKHLLARINLDDGGVFFVIAVVILLAGYFIHRHILNVSLGFHRNGVVLIPSALIAGTIIIDRSWKSINLNFLRGVVCFVTAMAIVLLAMCNLPSMHAVNVYAWDFQSSAGPLLRKLQAIDPKRTWMIGLTPKGTWSLSLPLTYYRQFGYKYRLARNEAPDVIVWHNEKDKIPNALFFETDFFEKFNCTIGVNRTSLNSDNTHMEVRVKNK